VRAALEAVHHGSGSAPLLPLAAAGRRIFPRRWLTAALVVVAAAIGAILIGKATASDAWRWFGAEPAIAFAERDWILVADFRNQTQDPVFDRALNTAMSVALSQSRWVNLVSSTRVRESLRRMEKPEPTPVDERVGREIAQREGLKLVIAPSIESSGGTYVLRAAIVEAAKGTALRTETVSAPNRNAVLPAVDELSRRIRLDLGEAAAVTTQTKPLAKVTTASLDALRQFTLAREAHTTQQFDKARSLYEEALHLDPTFTAARAMLGIINVEFFDRAKGLELLEQATKAVDGLTESERATVLGFHATFVEKNLQKAADQYRAYLAVYPDAATAHNNLGRVYMQMGRFDDAIAELETSIRLDPDLMLTYFSLNSIYLYRVADLDAAIALCARQLARDNRNVHAYDQLGWAHLGKGELRQAETAFRRAIDLNPKLPVYRYRLAHTLRLQGRYSDALDELRKILEIDRAEWSARYDTGVVLEAAGERTRARQELRRAIVDRDRDLAAGRLKADEQLELAAALARVGEKPRADALGRRAGALASDLYVERAGLLCLLGQRDQALQVLEQAVTGGFRDIVWIRVDPDLDALRADPRFQTLVANMPRVR
jgi:tetratricopeptide (TPR) repeat protein